MNVGRQAAAKPTHGESGQSGQIPQKQSRHPGHPAIPDQSGGTKSVHGLGSVMLTSLGLLELPPACIQTNPFASSR